MMAVNPFMAAYSGAAFVPPQIAPTPSARPIIDTAPKNIEPENLRLHPYTNIPVTIDAGYDDNKTPGKKENYHGGSAEAYSPTGDNFFQSLAGAPPMATPPPAPPLAASAGALPSAMMSMPKKQKKSPYEKQLAKAAKEKAKKQ